MIFAINNYWDIIHIASDSSKVCYPMAFWISFYSMGFPCGSAGKESACNAGDLGFDPWVGDLGSIPGLGRSSVEGKGYPLQYSGLENSMDCIVLGVTKNQTRLNDFDFHFLCMLGFSLPDTIPIWSVPNFVCNFDHGSLDPVHGMYILNLNLNFLGHYICGHIDPCSPFFFPGIISGS